MTFVEAAIEILKREGKPLSSRRLAELAIKLNLLSVVGRDPEATMQERLDDAMSRAARHPDLVRLKPDTFGLHAYPERTEPANGAQGRAAAAAGDAAEEAGEAKTGRRRRRRGRRDGEAPVAGEGGQAAAGAAGDGEAADEADAPGGASVAASTEEAGIAAGAASAAEAGDPGDKKRRRRRGGRGRRRREEGPGEAGADSAAHEAGISGDEGEGGAEEAEADAQVVAAGAARPRSLPSEAAAAGSEPERSVSDEPAGAEDDTTRDDAARPEAPHAATVERLPDDEAGDLEELDADLDHDTGPLLAPAFGAEDVTRTDDDRTVRPEIRGSRDERHRRDRHHKGRDRHKERDAKKPEARSQEGGRAHEPRAPHEPRAHEAKQHERAAHEPRAHEPRAHEPRATGAAATTGERGLIDAILDVLRTSDGRPMHVRHIIENAVKRRLVDERTAANELIRQARAALVREQRDRDAEGLRARVRALGGGHYGAVDRKLDVELVQAERELGERALRVRDATRAALRRRLGRMVPAAFETLGRGLCDKLGVASLELVRRGEGVTYWGGARQSGVATVRALVAFRAGDVEITRRAVGELRAGLAAKGYDEGLLFAAGRPNAEALAELKHGGVSLYDGGALAQLLIKHGIGVRRVALPVDYLDLDFFAELTEG